ncbi:hypothetical protein AOQ84DRAFT_440752 [Glonium stellatum]|uniref:Uncharacterized protein n=1 Tax=Glonium stellatum TaxID=574774 RepID=A0A8E2JR82_9PEZI|nr:hypothetical protein AOQ84DRAFT_440752 [Glonium stellatum]
MATPHSALLQTPRSCAASPPCGSHYPTYSANIVDLASCPAGISGSNSEQKPTLPAPNFAQVFNLSFIPPPRFSSRRISRRDAIVRHVIPLLKARRIRSFSHYAANMKIKPVTNCALEFLNGQSNIKMYVFQQSGQDSRMVPLRMLKSSHVKRHDDRRSWVEVRTGGIWAELTVWLDGLPVPCQVFNKFNSTLEWKIQRDWWSANGKAFQFLDLPWELREAIYVQIVQPVIYPNYREERVGVQRPDSESRLRGSRWYRTAVIDELPREACVCNSLERSNDFILHHNLRAEVPNVQVLSVQHKHIGAEAARVLWEGTWKCFWDPRNLVGFAGLATTMNFGSDYLLGRWWKRAYGSSNNWLSQCRIQATLAPSLPFSSLRRIILEFSPLEYVNFFAVAVPSFKTAQEDFWGAAEVLKQLPDLQHILLCFGERCINFSDPWNELSLQPSNRYLNGATYSICDRGVLVDWILSYAYGKGYILDIPKVEIGGNIQPWVKEKWEDILRIKRNGAGCRHEVDFDAIERMEGRTVYNYLPLCECEVRCDRMDENRWAHGEPLYPDPVLPQGSWSSPISTEKDFD